MVLYPVSEHFFEPDYLNSDSVALEKSLKQPRKSIIVSLSKSIFGENSFEVNINFLGEI